MNMTLTLEVTWPVERNVPIQMDCDGIECIYATHAIRNGNDIIIRDAFGETNRVHDVDRYRIRCHDGIQLNLELNDDGQGPRGSNYQDIWPQENFTHDTLVLILESPHKDEYRDNCIDIPIAPAQNNIAPNNNRIIGTGIGIANHLLDIISLCPSLYCNLSVGETRVILCNPIQFQTSLVAVIDVPNRKGVRDAVWKEFWNMQEIKNNFEDRLESYEPNYIINACTSRLQNKISEFLLQCNRFPDSMKYETYHPSVWHRRQRKLTHIA